MKHTSNTIDKQDSTDPWSNIIYTARDRRSTRHWSYVMNALGMITVYYTYTVVQMLVIAQLFSILLIISELLFPQGGIITYTFTGLNYAKTTLFAYIKRLTTGKPPIYAPIANRCTAAWYNELLQKVTLKTIIGCSCIGLIAYLICRKRE